MDPVGNVFVTDSLNNSCNFRSITSGDVVSTLARTAHRFGQHRRHPARPPCFSTRRMLVVDKTGNVYVGDQPKLHDSEGHAAGVVSTVAGLAGFFGTNDGTGSEARFGAL